MVHLGDIKPGSVACSESVYQTVAEILGELTVQTFVIVGDNEWNDCADPAQAWALWTSHFARFHEQWSTDREVSHQPERDENFSFVEDGVLFIGLNLVGGRVHDSDEWQQRLEENATWVETQLGDADESTYAAVVLGHALMMSQHRVFQDRFRAAGGAFGKPILYLHGDGHFWSTNRPWPERNILRVQVDRGGIAPPVEVTVSESAADAFTFERRPLGFR